MRCAPDGLDRLVQPEHEGGLVVWVSHHLFFSLPSFTPFLGGLGFCLCIMVSSELARRKREEWLDKLTTIRPIVFYSPMLTFVLYNRLGRAQFLTGDL